MWGDYGPNGMLVEKKAPSVSADDKVEDKYEGPPRPYVFNDIATCFTLLVGIYFPSVTGEWRAWCGFQKNLF